MLDARLKQTVVGIERHVQAKGFVTDAQRRAVFKARSVLEGMGS